MMTLGEGWSTEMVDGTSLKVILEIVHPQKQRKRVLLIRGQNRETRA